MDGFILISAMTHGGRSRSTRPGGASSTIPRCVFAVRLGCCLWRCRWQVDQSRLCAHSSMSSPTTTSCWWSPGRWRVFAIAAPIRSSCCRASRDQPSPPSLQSCARCSIPNTAPLRALPREDRDLFIAASNGHVLAFDNVSGLPAWISDTLCRLATGGGFAVRQLTPTRTRCCSMPPDP